MTNLTIGRVLLVVVTIFALAFTVTAVSAHGNDSAGDDAPPYDGSAAEWAAWMETHMTEHMGPGAVEWMESHMGVTVEEMGEDTADDGRMTGYGGMGGNGHC